MRFGRARPWQQAFSSLVISFVAAQYPVERYVLWRPRPLPWC